MAGQGKKKEEDRRQEVLGILVMAFAVLLLLGFVSYHPGDYPASGSPEAVQNWLGLAGAHISHWLFIFTIGYSSFTLPFLFFVFGWNLFLQRDLRPFFRLALYVLAFGVFLSTALAMPGVVSGDDVRISTHLHGLLGRFFAEKLNQYLGIGGSVVVMLTFLILILISATSWSMRDALLRFTDEIKLFVNGVGRKLKQRPPKKEKKVRPDIKTSRPAREDAPKAPSAQPVSMQERPDIRFPESRSAAAERPGASKEPVVKPAASSAEQRSGASAPAGPFQLPSLELLRGGTDSAQTFDRQALEKKAHFLEEKLREFDVKGNVVGVVPGPIITRFEIRPAPGVKVNRFINCQDDLALVMRAPRVRVVAPIPGKAAVGIEIPNESPSMVVLKDIIESRAFQRSESKLTLALGKTIDDKPFVADLAEMPHLLVAGATGSGKSVCLNAFIVSLLYNAKPSEVRLVLIDPKKLELNLYRRLKHHHLTTREGLGEDVITTVDNAVAVMRSLETEMEHRYRYLARAGVRNIADFNRAVEQGRIQIGEGDRKPEKLPYIVLVVDELADLMLTGAKDVEEPIARLAQMSRAVGIHLILATQRPSVDVITGVIKANFPSRIAFQVAQKNDSRTILDRNGAEKLLGKGDMLYLSPREHDPVRIHGAFVSTEEVQSVVSHVARQPRGEGWKLPGYAQKESSGRSSGGGRYEQDELFTEAAKLVIRHQQGSASLLQRRLRVGYARAGRLVDELEEAGILGPFDGSKAREVLVDESYLEELDKLTGLQNGSDEGDLL